MYLMVLVRLKYRSLVTALIRRTAPTTTWYVNTYVLRSTAAYTIVNTIFDNANVIYQSISIQCGQLKFCLYLQLVGYIGYS